MCIVCPKGVLKYTQGLNAQEGLSSTSGCLYPGFWLLSLFPDGWTISLV